MSGSLSSCGFHPSGGDAGGDIKNCLVRAGGCKCWSSMSEKKEYIKVKMHSLAEVKIFKSKRHTMYLLA